MHVGVAEKILGTDDADLEINALKVKKLFRPALQQAIDSGTTSKKLYAFILMVRNNLHADIEECEGFNSLIRTHGVCP